MMRTSANREHRFGRQTALTLDFHALFTFVLPTDQRPHFPASRATT